MTAVPVASDAVLWALLADGTTRTAFLDFCKTEHCDENVQVVMRIMEWDAAGATPADKLRPGAEVHRMIRTGVVNASGKVKSVVESGMAGLRGAATSGTDGADHIALLTTTFHGVKAAATRELVAGALIRFLASPAGKAVTCSLPSGSGSGSDSGGDGAPSSRRTSVGAALMRSLGSSVRFRGEAGGATAGLASRPSMRSGSFFGFMGAAPTPLATGGAGAPAPPVASAFALDLTGVAERRESLLQLLRHPVARVAFLDFCRAQHNDENVDLLLDLNGLRAAVVAERAAKAPGGGAGAPSSDAGGTPSSARRHRAGAILDTYIRSGSPREVNIDSRTRVLAEMYLSKSASAVDVGDEDEDDTTPIAGIWSTPAPNALGRVETELMNILSGEVVPRFAASRVWAECPVNLAAGMTMPAHATMASTPGSSAAATPAAAGSAPASATHASSGLAAGGGGLTGWMRKLGGGGGGGGAPGEGAPSEVIASLRDKLYLFGVSVKPRLFAGSKKAELDALGVEVRATALKAGYVFKRAQHKKSWKRRWFVLTPQLLAYFDTPTAASPSGVILLSEVLAPAAMAWDATWAATVPSGEGAPPDPSGGEGSTEVGKEEGGVPLDIMDLPFVFHLPTAHRVYTLQGSSDKDRARWMYAINHARTGDAEAVRAAEATAYAHIPTIARLSAARTTPTLRTMRPPTPVLPPIAVAVTTNPSGSSGEEQRRSRTMSTSSAHSSGKGGSIATTSSSSPSTLPAPAARLPPTSTPLIPSAAVGCGEVVAARVNSSPLLPAPTHVGVPAATQVVATGGMDGIPDGGDAGVTMEEEEEEAGHGRRATAASLAVDDTWDSVSTASPVRAHDARPTPNVLGEVDGVEGGGGRDSAPAGGVDGDAQERWSRPSSRAASTARSDDDQW